MTGFPRSVARLVDAVEQLPGVGPKSAQRLALWLLREPQERMASLAQALLEAIDNVRLCPVCGYFAEGERCSLCNDPRRRDEVICVVADARDLMAIEGTGWFDGRYHLLGGLLSPMDGIGPDDLAIGPLLTRLDGATIDEVILALSPTPEGDTTASYLARLLRSRGVRVTRPALGLPVGGDLTYADQVTIEQALAGRREL